MKNQTAEETPLVLVGNDLLIAEAMLNTGFISIDLESPFALSSGLQSCFYIGGRADLTNNPYLEVLLGAKMLETLAKITEPADKQICLIGVPTVGTTLAQAIVMVSEMHRIRINGQSICHRVLRQIPKGRVGLNHRIDGQPMLERQSYFLVENAVTTAASLVQAAEAMAFERYLKPAAALILVDREQGGMAQLKTLGYRRVTTVYRLRDILWTLAQHDWISMTVYQAYDEEVRQLNR